MSVEPGSRRRTAARHGRWLFAVTAVVLGIAFLAAGLARGDLGLGLIGLVVMLAYGGGMLLLGRRLEPADLLGGGAADERQERILLRSTAATGQVLIGVLVVGMLVSSARGAASAGTWSALCAVGGLSFVLTTVYFSRRS